MHAHMDGSHINDLQLKLLSIPLTTEKFYSTFCTGAQTTTPPNSSNSKPTMAPSAIGSVLLLALVAYLTHWYLQWRRLSHIPGPTFAALSKLWLIKVGLNGRSPHAFKELQDQYGGHRYQSAQARAMLIDQVR